jgi:hypothetical protein
MRRPQANEASISRDVVTGTPSAPLSKRARAAKKEKTKAAKKAAKAKAKALTPKASSSKEGAKGASLGAPNNDMETLNPPSRCSSPEPVAAGDRHDPLRLQCWEALFDSINEALHIAGMVVERLNPSLALQYHQLSESLKADYKKHGEFLSLNDGLLPGLAVHFNMQPGDEAVHLDGMSLFAGWVRVSISRKPGSTPNSSLRMKC